VGSPFAVRFGATRFKRAESRFSQAFIGAIVDGSVLYKCCSSGGGDDCDGGGTLLESGNDAGDIEMLVALLGEIAAAVKLPDMYFNFNTGDQPFTDKPHWTPIPQLQWVRSQNHWTIPLPNPFHLRAHIDGRLGNNAVHSHHVDWSKKIPKIFWRGSLSFPDIFQLANLDVVPRMRLQKLAKQNPSLFDVAIVNVDQEVTKALSKDELKSIHRRLIKGPHINDMRAVLPKYKYLINVAAVLSSWRLVELLASGSVLLLPEDSDNELIYDWLTPWEHFVPFNSELSDLVPKVQWLESHPEEAKAIAARGFQHFIERVRQQDTHCYLLQTLLTLNRTLEPQKLPPLKDLKQAGWKKVKPTRLSQLAPKYVPLTQLIDTPMQM